jgi:hypothetical protein
MMQAIGRLEQALGRAEKATRDMAEARRAILEAEPLSSTDASDVEIDPYSRDKAIAALKSLDALIGDLQKARGDG